MQTQSNEHHTPAELTPHEQEAERLAALCADYSNPDHHAAYTHYCDTLHRAMRGVVWTPERVRRLYPVLAEICEEQDEIAREGEEMEAAVAAGKSEADRLTRIMEDTDAPPDVRAAIITHIDGLAARTGVALATPGVLSSALPTIFEEAWSQGISLDAPPSFDAPSDAQFAAESEVSR